MQRWEGLEDESEEEKYKREKLAEIRELQSKEVFVERNTGRWECQACGFVYDEKDGYEKRCAQGNAVCGGELSLPPVWRREEVLR